MTIGKIFKLPIVGRKAFSMSLVSDRHGSATRAAMVTGEHAFESKLLVKVFDKNGRERKVTEYFGDRKDESKLAGRLHNRLQKLWMHVLYRNKTQLDLGSGLITNVSQLALANDWNLAAPSGAAINLLKLANWHATGTGTTAAAATNIMLQAADAVAPVAGAQSLVSAANLQKYQTVATLSYTATEAVTEWGLFTSGTLSDTTGSPATASSATSLTATGTPYTASSSTVQGKEQNIVYDATAGVWGYVTGNTTSVLSVPAWYKKTDGTAGSTPGSTDAFALQPIMLDHKQFGAINVVNGDSIQITYQLTCATGG